MTSVNKMRKHIYTRSQFIYFATVILAIKNDCY